jgi:hypothetical protein
MISSDFFPCSGGCVPTRLVPVHFVVKPTPSTAQTVDKVGILPGNFIFSFKEQKQYISEIY